MSIDNFALIRSLLSFDDPTALYHVVILARRKDNPDLPHNAKRIRSYCLRSLEEYDRCHDSITNECQLRNARAYIDVSAKSNEKVALWALKKTAELIYDGQFDAVRHVYDSACASSKSIGVKLWLIDIDVKSDEVVDCTQKAVIELGGEIRAVLPTRCGTHLITTPFPLNKLEVRPDVTILKRAQTLLYTPPNPM